ncbi:MAG: aldehyde dehydrogenase family protein [SAR324 cluster bacterium]|nr:aldehyde dehydrogenase family protein [SAR324 cluster bacterium]
MKTVSCISPIDSKILATRELTSDAQLDKILARAKIAQKEWAATSIKTRVEAMEKFLVNLQAMDDEIVPELAKQMGRPIRFGGEVPPLVKRVKYLNEMASSALANYVPETNGVDQITRYIKRIPVGIVFVIAPWNYPYVTAVNGIVPSLLAGNAVILKHAVQSLLVGERFYKALQNVGLPAGLFSNILIENEQAATILKAGKVNHVTFTGSVRGGREVEQAAAGSFTTMNLELGGKDAAYVCKDANLELTVADLAEGAFFNGGQCCCGIERIYVEEAIFDKFVEALVAEAKKLKLGDPLDVNTTLGPMASLRFADSVRGHISSALSQGAKALIDSNLFPQSKLNTPYLAPQVLVNVDHSMEIMTEETFGPVVGVMPVKNDKEALALINDSKYGLTSSIWTKDQVRAVELADQIETGIIYMNRCDHVDPSLVWAGVKQTGRGASLSKYGFDALTKPKSYHLRQGTNFC